jgi:hypothetical protein
LRAGQKSDDTVRGRLGVVVSRQETIINGVVVGGREEERRRRTDSPGRTRVCLCVLRGSRGREGGREGCSSLLATALDAQAA